MTMMDSKFVRSDIPGWGVDRVVGERPGVPKEKEPAPLVATTPAQQQNGPAPFVGPNRFLTPVYSTAMPPRGLSGLMRRAAYKVPDYNPKRWMLLVLSDRIDALEHGGAAKLVLGASAFVIALSVVKILRA